MLKGVTWRWTIAVAAITILIWPEAICYAEKVPAPEEILGFRAGADFHLASYQQAVAYVRALEKSSPRIKVFEMGKTSMGKTMIYAVISSEENLAKLDRFKEISKRLALGRGLSDEEVAQMAAEGRAVVWVDGGLHASEVAPAQHTLQLAYDMVASEDSATRLIRENVILILVWPNPDGMDLVSEWYHSNVGTPYEVSPMPWVYNKYVGHDNNRDSYMVNQLETQNLTRLVNYEWYPQVLYNQHQRGPFPARIWIPPASEPANPNIHPLVVRWQNLIGTAMGAAFEREKKGGVISRVRYDTWYPGYVTQVVDFHNIISILTETNLYNWATPHFYTIDDFPEDFQELTVGAFYPNPWKGGWWRLRDAVEYCLTASKAVLHTSAVYRESLLTNRYAMGKDVIERFTKEPPHAWIVPQEQWDPPTAALLLNKMILLGIEVYQAKEGFVSDGVSYPAGTWVIPMAQPFALFLKAVFEEQSYPDLIKYPSIWQGLVRPEAFPGAYLPPYDIAGWTLPYQTGVKAIPAQTPVQVEMTPVDKVVAPGRVEPGAGYAYVISPKINNSFVAVNRILAKKAEVLRAQEPFSLSGRSYPAGTWVIPAASVSSSLMESFAKDLSLPVGAAAARVSAKTFKVTAPRVGLYKSWVANMDEGWTRWLFEQFEFPYTNIYDADVKAGGLAGRFDVIVIPSQDKEEIVEGHRKGIVPPQYVGGMTETGVRNLKDFVEGGGILVTLNSACLFAIDEMDLPVSDVLKDLRPSGREEAPKEAAPPKFACPGSLLRVDFATDHLVAFGMPEEAAVMFNDSPAFKIHPSFGDKGAVVIAKYPTGNLLMSGYLLGEEYLKNQAAALEVPLGAGKVILLGFGVQNRGQPHGTFKLLFNSLYYGSLAGK